jgi:hypothetical protein
MRSGVVLSLLIVLCAPVSAAVAGQVHRHHATAHSRVLTTGTAAAWAYSPARPDRHRPTPHYNDQPEPGYNPYERWGG